MDEVAQLARALNTVQTTGQAIAAIDVAIAQGIRVITMGAEIGGSVANETAGVQAIISALHTERRQLTEVAGDGSGPVDAARWARIRRQIERIAVTKAGFEGRLDVLRNLSFFEAISDAIRLDVGPALRDAVKPGLSVGLAIAVVLVVVFALRSVQ